MPACLRALSAVTVSVLWCLVADSETPSHGNPVGDRIPRSPSPRAVVVKKIQLSKPDQAQVGAWNADGSRIALGFNFDNRIGVWEFPSGRRLAAPQNEIGGVSHVVY